MDENTVSFTADDLDCCLITLEFVIRDAEWELENKAATKEERMSITNDIHTMKNLQNTFSQATSSFKTVDLLYMYRLLLLEREDVNGVLDNPNCDVEMRTGAQTFLRRLNSIIRKLKKLFPTVTLPDFNK